VDLSGKDIAEGAVALALVVALLAGIADWRHRKRDDLDRVAWFDWRSVQVFALIAAIVAFSLAVNL
jgi:amino acid transporter